MVYFHRVTPAVMVNELQSEFGGSTALIGLLSSAYFYSYTLVQIPVGYLTDRIPARILIGSGLMLASAGSVAFGFARTFAQAMTARTITGLGVATVLVPSYKILGIAFGERYTTANGLLMSAGALGSLAATSPLVALMQLIGWRNTFFFAAGVSAAVALSCITLINGPWDAERKSIKGGIDFKSMAKLLPISIVPGFILFFMYGTLVSYQGLWGVPFLMKAYGMNKPEASGIMLLISLGTAIAGAGIGALTGSGKVKERSLGLASCLIFLMCWIPMLLPASRASEKLVTLSALLIGGSHIIALILINNYVRTKIDVKLRGSVLGMNNMITLLGGAVFQPLMGFAISAPVGYQGAFALGAAGAMAAFFLMRRLMSPDYKTAI